ncbi:RNA helicase [Trifolium repens]|nr:RNA helicase [Trifolium repens]
MQEANQEVTAWLSRFAARSSFGGGKNRRSGGRFGDPDYHGAGNSSGGYGASAFTDSALKTVAGAKETCSKIKVRRH